VVAVTIAAVGHVFAGTARGTPVRLVLLRCFFVARPTTLTTGVKTRIRIVRVCTAVYVAVQTFEPIVHRVGDVITETGAMLTDVVTVGACRAVDGFVFFRVLGQRDTRDDTRNHEHRHSSEVGSGN